MAEPTSWPRFTTAQLPYVPSPNGLDRQIASRLMLRDRCSESDGASRSGSRQGAPDQRVGPASAPVRSLMAASNWLAEVANVNLSSSRKAEKMPTTAGMPLMSARIGEPE